MTPDEKSRLSAMRKAGRSYTEIADALGMSKNTVKTFCRRNGLTPEVESASTETTPVVTTDRLCPHCGKPVVQPLGRKEKKFCSDTCRNRWWNSHMDLVNRKAIYEYTCPTCGTVFTAYGNNHRKYCCHECYIDEAFRKACEKVTRLNAEKKDRVTRACVVRKYVEDLSRQAQDVAMQAGDVAVQAGDVAMQVHDVAIWDEQAWRLLVEKVTVFADGSAEFLFRGGNRIAVRMG